MPFAIHCDEVNVQHTKSKNPIPETKSRIPLKELSNVFLACTHSSEKKDELESYQQASCENEYSLFDETEKTVIDINVHQSGSQVENNDCLLNLFETEMVINSNYLQGHKINPFDRKFLINWLVELHSLSKLSQETLFLSVVTIDRFLQVNAGVECDLQLLGLASMCIVSECEDGIQKKNGSFKETVLAYAGYTHDELISMDNRIHETLGLILLTPHYFVSLHLNFLENFLESAKLVYDWLDDCHDSFAKYLLELSLHESELWQYLPSHLAAASLCLSLKITGSRQTSIDVLWNLNLICSTRCTYNTLKPIVKKMCWLIIESESSIYQAIRKKYFATHIKVCETVKVFYEFHTYDYDDTSEKKVSSKKFFPLIPEIIDISGSP